MAHLNAQINYLVRIRKCCFIKFFIFLGYFSSDKTRQLQKTQMLQHLRSAEPRFVPTRRLGIVAIQRENPRSLVADHRASDPKTLVHC